MGRYTAAAKANTAQDGPDARGRRMLSLKADGLLVLGEPGAGAQRGTPFLGRAQEHWGGA